MQTFMRTTQAGAPTPPLQQQQQSATRPSRPLSSRHMASSSGSPSSGCAHTAQLSHSDTPIYKPLRYLGRGSFGVVLLAEDTQTGERVAIKRVRYDPRLHNREVAILNTILVDQKATTTTTFNSRVKCIGSRTRPLHEKQERVENWVGRHHPNIVELMDSYITYDRSPAEVDATAAFHAQMHSQPGFPMSDFGGAGVDNSAFAYLEMVMSYLPMDLYALKKHFYRHHAMPSAEPSTSAVVTRAAGEGERDEEGRGPQQPHVSASSPHAASRPASPRVVTHMPLRWVKIFLFQLARALVFMHAHHVCHRDLKPANVLVDPDTGRLQLCDFGSAKQILSPGREKNVSYICSRYYRAPELLFGALHYGCEVDMWSYGCLLAELLRESGRPLFRGCTSVDQMAELFKVMGAPSKREMYAMNPQCAKALLRTHAMHKPRLMADTEYDTNDLSDADGGLHNHSSGSGIDGSCAHHDGFIDDEDTSLGTAERHHANYAASTPDGDDMGGDGVTDDDKSASGEVPTPFNEYYDVLKVRAIPWRTLFPIDTPHEAVSLATGLLCYAPQKRLSALEVVEHPFFDDLFTPTSTSEAPAAGVDDRATKAVMVDGSADADDSSLRMPNGRLLPLEMFQVTETERGLFTEAFLAKMTKQAELISAAMAKEEGNRGSW